MIFTGTPPESVGKINVGDRYEGFLNGQSLFYVDIKASVKE